MNSGGASGEDGERRYPKRVRKVVDKEYFALDKGTCSNPRRWTAKNKETLLFNLEKYGDQDVSLLSSKVGKGANVVHSYLAKHKELAKEKTPRNNKSVKLERLETWLEYMRVRKHKYPIPSPMALSMLMISLMEDHPVSTSDEVNFAEAYEYMFELLSGRHISRHSSKLSEPTRKFIKLTVTCLMHEVEKNLPDLHGKFLKETPAGRDADSLPPYVNKLLDHDFLNPLKLQEDAIEADILPPRKPPKEE